MFWKKKSPDTTPEALADGLHDALQRVAPSMALYEKMVHPDDDERHRFYFSVILLPLVISHFQTIENSDAKIRSLLTAGYEIYLNRLRDQQSLVRTGDYVIWRIEQGEVARVLRERFFDLVTDESLGNHQIKYGVLIRVVADVRKAMVNNDFNIAARHADSSHPKDVLAKFFLSIGTSFTRQDLSIYPNDPNLSETDAERLEGSIALAAQFIGELYFKIMELHKNVKPCGI